MISFLKNVFKFGWDHFSRNKGLSLQVIFIMSIAVLTVTSLFMFKGLTDFLISEVQKKVDVSVYFKKDVPEEKILQVKEELFKFSREVQDVDYVSREQALKSFSQKHQDDSVYLKALEELQENPFLASLNIKASNPDYYAQIYSFLQNKEFGSVVEKVSYNKTKEAIERLIAIINGVKKAGVFLSIILGVFVIIITFNVIKLSILIARDEVMMMRLVGASNWFIRGPFLVQGFFCALFAVLMVNIFFFLGLLYLNAKIDVWFLDFNFVNYFQEHLPTLLVVQIGLAIILSTFATSLALKKHLKI